MASGNYLESPFLIVLYFVSPKRKCCSLFPQYSSLFFSISLSDIPSYNLFFQCPHSFYPIYHPIISNLPPNYISTCSFRLSSILVKASPAFPTCTTVSLALISLLPFLSHYWPLSIATKMIHFWNISWIMSFLYEMVPRFPTALWRKKWLLSNYFYLIIYHSISWSHLTTPQPHWFPLLSSFLPSSFRPQSSSLAIPMASSSHPLNVARFKKQNKQTNKNCKSQRKKRRKEERKERKRGKKKEERKKVSQPPNQKWMLSASSSFNWICYFLTIFHNL